MAITIVLGFVLPPTVNLKHFRGLLSQSLSRSLNRQASVQDVHLRLLPLPGFTFRRLQIGDDEEFGGEPILQTLEDDGQYSQATLRLSSLWRGRFEIASVSLTQASLNLVRAPDGHWNLERLINRAAQVPSAPTAKKKPEVRARFPYIELKDSRINFKFGSEKKPFSLSEAEFALWLAAENRWNVRLKAVPLRTDESVSDTGTIRLSGSFDRANDFAQTPFHFQVSWDRPEVDAITRIARGHDPGWRGAVDLTAELKGTPADFTAFTDAAIAEFRRYDIARNTSFDVRINCSEHFLAREADGSQLGFKCRLPLDSGVVTAAGELHPGKWSDLSLRIFASEVPVPILVRAMLHAKSTLPDDLSADGVVGGDWSIERSAGNPVTWKGALTVTNAVLHSGVLGPALVFPHAVSVSFGAAPATQSKTHPIHGSASIPPAAARAMIEPFNLDLGGEVEVSAAFDPQGYRMDVTGPVGWQRLLQAAQVIGLHPPATDLEGSGSIVAHYSGQWRHFVPPAVSATAQVRTATMSLRGFTEPLRLTAGTLKFDGETFVAERIAADFPHSGLAFTGSLSGNRQCEQHLVCDVSFALQSETLTDKSLLQLLSSSNASAFSFFGTAYPFQATWLLALPATGTIQAQHLVIHDLHADNVNAVVQVNANKISVHHCTADLFDGKHEGDWTFDFSTPRPIIVGSGVVRNARMETLRAAVDEPLASGVLDLQYKLVTSGADLDQLLAATTGGGTFSWHNGTIQTVHSEGETAGLRFRDWSGRFLVEKQSISLRNTKMDSSSGIHDVSGKVSFDRQWNLHFLRTDGSGFVATGSISNPVVSNETSNLTEARR